MNAASWRYLFLLLVATALASCVRFTPTYNEPAPGSYETRMYQVQIDDSVRSIQGAEVTLEFSQSAGAQPLLGRFFVDADEGSSTAVVVVGHGFWMERFASSSEVIGRSIEIDGRRATVVGVGPPGFALSEGAELWTPRSRTRPTSTRARSVERDDASVISGRVEDPLQLKPDGLELRVGSQTELGVLQRSWIPELIAAGTEVERGERERKVLRLAIDALGR